MSEYDKANEALRDSAPVVKLLHAALTAVLVGLVIYVLETVKENESAINLRVANAFQQAVQVQKIEEKLDGAVEAVRENTTAVLVMQTAVEALQKVSEVELEHGRERLEAIEDRQTNITHRVRQVESRVDHHQADSQRHYSPSSR